MKDDWKTISLQLPQTWLEKILKKAKRETLSMSAYIRKLLLEDIKDDLPDSK